VQERIVREREPESDTEQTRKLKSRRWKRLAILAVSAILLASPMGWLAYYRQAESPLDALEKQGNSIRTEAIGPAWFRRYAEKWNLPVPKRIVQFDSSTANNKDLAIVAEERSLRVLFLIGSPVTDAGLAHLREHPNVWQVFIKDMRITDAGVQHLGQVPKLRALWLRGTEVTDAGLVHLKGLKNLSNLGLADTGITDDGLAILSSFGSLRHIELDRTQVTDEGLKHLYKMKQLIGVSLKGTRVTPEGIARLKAAIPGVKVSTD
jgi:hypothetical protein